MIEGIDNGKELILTDRGDILKISAGTSSTEAVFNYVILREWLSPRKEKLYLDVGGKKGEMDIPTFMLAQRIGLELAFGISPGCGCDCCIQLRHALGREIVKVEKGVRA
jgi:hypothetical protein